MGYFNIFHYISIAFFVLLFVLLAYLSKKETNKKIFLSMILASFLVTSTGAIFSLFIIDKYTKKAKLMNVKSRRVLRNESMMVSGVVKNVGKFSTGTCKLKIKVVNRSVDASNLAGNVFTPTSGLGDLLTNKNKKPKTNKIEIEKKIASNLDPGEYENFAVSFKYPSYFSNPYQKFELNCK